MNDTVAQLTSELQSLAPAHLEIEDESYKHAGHTGASEGSHFKLLIVSPQFDGLTLIKRHKLVYDTLDELMKTQIHALSIQAKTPAEYQA